MSHLKLEGKDSSKDAFPASQPTILTLVDFCKGLSIAAIFLYHFDDKYMPLGWQGVHIFIILSGFGLTYSCLRQQLKSSSPIAWKQWYIKRTQRILPTYWAVCVVTALMLLIKVAFTGSNVVGQSVKIIAQTITDLLLLRNFNWVTIFNYNGPLWFVPLIISLYLIFPFLYSLIKRYETPRQLALLFLIVLGANFAYRGLAIYGLDGLPIGYENTPEICATAIAPLDRFPDTAFFPFQRQATFGLFPARLGEFMLGMVSAALFLKNEARFNQIALSYGALAIGLGTWLIGNHFTCSSLTGWIFSDFVIAIGLMTILLNVAQLFAAKLPSIFKGVSWLGMMSFYPFLIHEFLIVQIFPRVGGRIDPALITTFGLTGFILFELFILGLVVVTTWLLSGLLLLFDRSHLPQVIIQQTLSKVIKT